MLTMTCGLQQHMFLTFRPTLVYHFLDHFRHGPLKLTQELEKYIFGVYLLLLILRNIQTSDSSFWLVPGTS